MKKGAFLILTLLACCIVQLSFSQPICGFDEAHAGLMNTNPDYRKHVLDNEARIQTIIKNQQARRAAQPANARTSGTLSTLYTIPVVVHVIHTGGAIGTTYNPTDAQIQGAINYLNQVYNGTYTGTEGIGDIQIQFALATRDQSCNTSGVTAIERIDFSSNATYVSSGVSVPGSGGSGVSETVVKNLSRWNPSSYYNIWVVNKLNGADGTSGQFIAGYAYFAGASPSLDGIVMLATQMKTGQKTLPHEIGHALSLYHPFEGSTDVSVCPSTSCSAGDLVCDTDPISENISGGVVDFTCRSGTNSCTGTAYSINTEHNYMNYTNCYTLFTSGQRDRMQAAMSLPDRASFVNAWSLSSTYPISSLTAPTSTCSVTSGSANTGVGLMAVSVDNRTFSSGTSGDDGGYVNKTTDCNSLIYLQAGGTYTLKATLYGLNNEQMGGAWIDYNNDGAYSASEQIMSRVNNIAAPGGGVIGYPTVSQSFTIPASATTATVLRMRVIEEASTIYGGAVAITSACTAPFYGQAEDYPVYIAATVLPLTLEYFKGEILTNTNHLSWKSTSEVNTDSFEIERSYNGTSFEPIGTVAASGVTGGSVYTFDDKSATGNVVYYRLKEIDYSGPSKFSNIVTMRKGTSQESLISILNNPFRESFNISITNTAQSKVAINLLDVTGKLIYTQTTEAINSGIITVTPNSKKLAEGMYLVQVLVNGKTFTKKVIKE